MQAHKNLRHFAPYAPLMAKSVALGALVNYVANKINPRLLGTIFVSFACRLVSKLRVHRPLHKKFVLYSACTLKSADCAVKICWLSSNGNCALSYNIMQVYYKWILPLMNVTRLVMAPAAALAEARWYSRDKENQEDAQLSKEYLLIMLNDLNNTRALNNMRTV